MPNNHNVESVAKIAAELEGTSAVWVVDYRGLTVKEAEALRRSIREAGATMGVYKNTLMAIALENAGQPELGDVLSGPSAFIFSKDDAAASAKALKEFAKTNKKLVIKGGIMEGKAVNAAEVEAIASLPSHDQLMAMVAGAISGVARGLAVTINGVPSGLAQCVKQIAEQKPAA